MAAISYILQGANCVAVAQDMNKHYKSPKYDQPLRSHPLHHYSNTGAPCSHICCDTSTTVMQAEYTE